MTRKAFSSDVQAASEKSIPGITKVGKGEDDGDVTFLFSPASGPPIEIGLLALDVSGYPLDNSFMIFTKSSDVPKGIDEVLEHIASSSTGMKIIDLIASISQRLRKTLATGSQEDPLSLGDNSDLEMLDEEGGESGDEDDIDEFDDGFLSDGDGLESFGPPGSIRPSSLSTYNIPAEAAVKINRRIRADFRAVKFAGFKLGVLSGLKAESQTSVISISIQAAKLGLSDEALQAWDLGPQQYIVLLMRYADGYKTFEAVVSEPAKSLEISFRIGVGNKYKPTLNEAHSAFTEITKHETSSHNGNNATSSDDKAMTGFSSLFISSSLNEFFNEQFISLLKIRSSMGLGWDGAKLFFNDNQGRFDQEASILGPQYYEESTPAQGSLPEMLCGDHLTDTNSTSVSFPLITAQFAMRYLLRCTEYCLVCHDKISGEFEALKPYVCDKPLCLYQYMSLGFGPSVEHEIMTQPVVVDLLVSFCYAAASNQRIREYPTGMSLLVPPVTDSTRAASNPVPIIKSKSDPLINPTKVKYDINHPQIVFENDQSCPVRNGDWVVIDLEDKGIPPIHHRVTDISMYPIVKLSECRVIQGDFANLIPANQTSLTKTPFTPATTPPLAVPVPAQMTAYDQNFDDVCNAKKAETIVVLLNTLPSIKQLRAYLVQQSRFSEPSLRTWKERVSPAALGLLRWIVASNRSCIVQVNKCPGQEDRDLAVSKIRLDQKCSNVTDSWVQFRFAQGAPDKEQRFLNALKTEKKNLHPKYPTLFAFHGSPLQNWHSIIRHGLDFKETLHGRAHGHGVYHAMDQATSAGYSGSGYASWPGSDLQISSAMSLNEIVNCPSQFISSNPYLVVQHLDWIQCRYLLVQVSQNTTIPTSNVFRAAGAVPTSQPEPSPFRDVAQDPKFTAKTTMNKPIGIPQCATSISRAFRDNLVAEQPPPRNKRRKHTSPKDQLTLAEVEPSDDEDPEDIKFLFSDDEESLGKGKGRSDELILLGSAKRTAKPQTDFVPGSLDQSKLPMLDPPSYATPSATMRLNRELQTILKVQKASPLHELGWYIDAELVSNVYQWIVELHSFEPTLPLAKDMKVAGVTSIVLEIRFGKDYPHSPPFVRVIRPRFLPFMSGGGGHVTGGGAMCMELLTNTGWSAVSSIEGVLLQVRMAIMNMEPKPARLESTSKDRQRDYGTSEAMQAYIRACQTHGWEIPKDFQDFGVGG